MRSAHAHVSWPHAPTSLTIESRQYDTRWSGWTFKRLPEDRQRAFERYSLRVITVKTPADRSGAQGAASRMGRVCIRHAPAPRALTPAAWHPAAAFDASNEDSGPDTHNVLNECLRALLHVPQPGGHL